MVLSKSVLFSSLVVISASGADLQRDENHPLPNAPSGKIYRIWCTGEVSHQECQDTDITKSGQHNFELNKPWVEAALCGTKGCWGDCTPSGLPNGGGLHNCRWYEVHFDHNSLVYNHGVGAFCEHRGRDCAFCGLSSNLADSNNVTSPPGGLTADPPCWPDWGFRSVGGSKRNFITSHGKYGIWENGQSGRIGWYIELDNDAPWTTTWTQRPLVADEGHALKSLASVTSDECKAACEADVACHSFSFSSEKARCHLKDKCANADEPSDNNPGHRGYVTYYQPCTSLSVV